MGILNRPAFEQDDDDDASEAASQVRHQVERQPPTQTRQSAASSPLLSRQQNSQGSRMAPNPRNSTPAPTTRVVTEVIRGSYVKIFKAELGKNAKEGDTPKFSMTLLIDKNDAVTLGKLESAAEAAVNLKWPAKRPARIDSTLHDGDMPRPSNGEPFTEECKGCMVMSVSSKFKPKILDRDGNEILDASQIGSGDYFKVSLGAYAYDTAGKRGVSFGLNNVLFWERGESLGGMGSASDDFAADLPQQG